MTTVTPQPQPWHSMWLWLNQLWTTDELAARLDRSNGLWCWRIVTEPKPIKRRRRRQ